MSCVSECMDILATANSIHRYKYKPSISEIVEIDPSTNIVSFCIVVLLLLLLFIVAECYLRPQNFCIGKNRIPHPHVSLRSTTMYLKFLLQLTVSTWHNPDWIHIVRLRGPHGETKSERKKPNTFVKPTLPLYSRTPISLDSVSVPFQKSKQPIISFWGCLNFI